MGPCTSTIDAQFCDILLSLATNKFLIPNPYVRNEGSGKPAAIGSLARSFDAGIYKAGVDPGFLDGGSNLQRGFDFT